MKYAKKILQLENDLEEKVKLSQSISIGFCAPGPTYVLDELVTEGKMPTYRHGKYVNHETLVNDLREGRYQMIITDTPCQEIDIYCKSFVSEQLYVSTPYEHPLTRFESTTFNDLNGNNFLMVEDIGVWKQLVEKNMPKSKFLLQDSVDALTQIVLASSLLSFATSITNDRLHKDESRVYIPITDPSACMHFYICCLKEKEEYLQPIIENMVKGIQ